MRGARRKKRTGNRRKETGLLRRGRNAQHGWKGNGWPEAVQVRGRHYGGTTTKGAY